ncbi:hypothetical protein CRYUN_Cryun22dG0043000 [Craigia yunnanensis]
MVIGRSTGFAAAFLTTLFILPSSFLVNAEDTDYPSVAYPPKSWRNVPVYDFGFWDSARVRPILIIGTFVCGFHCQRLQGNCLFAISIFKTNTSNGTISSLSPKIVWSVNRNNPVENRATLQLSEKGDLMLQDPDGTLVWNTNTMGKFVSGLSLTEEGNLVLYGRNNEMVWQSFDHPTDTLVPGQALVSGQKLTADLYSLALINDSLIAFLEPDAQQVYFGPMKVEAHEPGQHKVVYMNGRFDRFVLPSKSAAQFIQLGSDGHLRSNQFRESKWEQVSDLLINYTRACGFPLVCGEYGVCSDGNCSCPKAEGNEAAVYFDQVSQSNPNLGCYENITVSCKPSDYHSHSLLELKDFDCFNFVPHIENASREKCKEACLKNCSCKAAIHRQQINSSVGYCFLLSKIFSFKRNVDNLHNYNSFSYIKVQNPQITQTKSSNNITAIVGSTLGLIVFILLVVVGMFSLRRNKNDSKDEREDPQKLRRLRLTRFSYDYLCAMTLNFSVKLGEGGFGSVFYGSLPNSTMVAVKRLDGTDHVKKSFLAEVETLGIVNHINLVTLIGFCAEKYHRLLVYEYLQNGSLDRWIFSRNPVCTLSWKLRERIIYDVAKGLAYLHDGCNQKIIHLDIKPQNILLDENFIARVADFGLSKLIGRDQNQVLTTMRGTPGYMAPEWSSATITEKVDVYSLALWSWKSCAVEKM